MVAQEVESQYFTPPKLARRWGCKPATVVALIRSGELVAFNLAKPSCHRPRYRISPEAVERFEQGRAAVPQTKAVRTRKRPAGDVKSFV